MRECPLRADTLTLLQENLLLWDFLGGGLDGGEWRCCNLHCCSLRCKLQAAPQELG